MSAPTGAYVAFRHRDFRWFIAALFTLTLGIQAEALVVSWQLYEMTRDPLSLGLIGLAEAIPFIAVALPAGHLADHRDRRTLALLATAGLLGCALALVWFAAAPRTVTWPLYGVIVASGVARSVLQSARTALGAEIVPREELTNAITWRSSTWQLASVTGPAVAGVLYGWLGAQGSYVVVAVLYVAAFTGWALIRPRGAPPGTGARVSMAGLGAGVAFVLREKVLLGALTLDLFAVLFGGAVALLPVYAATILEVGPQGLGVLRAAPAAGAVLMSIAMAHLPLRDHVGRTLLVAVALFGVATIGFGVSTLYPLSVLLLFLGGVFDQVSVVIRSTLMTTLVPVHLMGRVAAVNSVFVGSSNEIGAFESGVAARLLGTVPAVVFGGAATLVVVAGTAWRFPALRRLRGFEHAATPGG